MRGLILALAGIAGGALIGIGVIVAVGQVRIWLMRRSR